jgi:dTMP kinase
VVEIASRGVFITLDGQSGVGKTTVSTLLAEFLANAGRVVTVTAEPSSSPLGDLARFGTHEYHGRALSCLIAADRYHHDDVVIGPALERGEIVICDRYLPSSFVLDQMDGVPFDFVWNMYQGLRWPDTAVFLRAEPEVCHRRAAERGGNHSRFHGDLAVKRREGDLFDHVAGDLSARGYPVVNVDIGQRTAPAVARALQQIAEERLGLAQPAPPTAGGGAR